MHVASERGFARGWFARGWFATEVESDTIAAVAPLLPLRFAMAHDHHHHHHAVDYGRAFAIGIVLNTAFVAVEAGFGWWTESLALLADAGHNLGDVLGLIMAWTGEVLARREPTSRRTYGLRRSSILAALFNAVFLLVAVGAIAWEAILRFRVDQTPASGTVMAVAAIGIVVNMGTALLFFRGRHDDLNVRGAYLHMAADAGVSLGVVLAGFLMRQTGWSWIDPSVGLLIAGVILFGTWGLLRESLDLALDAVPRGIDPDAVRDYLQRMPEVTDVHDLHIWGLSTQEAALTVHLGLRDLTTGDALLPRVVKELHDRFGIEHVTIQFERSDAGCAGGKRCDIAPAGKRS